MSEGGLWYTLDFIIRVKQNLFGSYFLFGILLRKSLKQKARDVYGTAETI